MSVKLFESDVLNVKITTVVGNDGEVYFKANDVAISLGYSNPKHAIQTNVWNKNKFEWGNMGGLDQAPRIQSHTLFLTEPGVYQLIFKSELPSAENFQDWVFSKVLPSIRRTGNYSNSNRAAAIEGTVLERLESIDIEGVPKYDRRNTNDGERIGVNTKAKKIVEESKNARMAELGSKGGKKLAENRKNQVEKMKKLLEFKNMFLGLYEALFGTDE